MRHNIHALLRGSLAALALTAAVTAGAQTFNPQRTLRADYQLTGDVKGQAIALTELCSTKGWAGRRAHLDSVPARGNGDVTLRDKSTGRVIYRQSFSTLFQEWLSTEEATHTPRAFELSLPLPMPDSTATVTVRLFDKTGKVSTEMTHTVDPTDILIRKLDALPVPPHKYLLRSGSPEEKIDVAIVAEGYQASQADAFYRDAQTAVDAILAHEPFKKLRDRFNFVAVAAASKDSDVSIPKEGLWRQTALSSHFSTFYSDRYLTTLHVRDLANLLAGIPYEHVIILANTYTYGGGGIYNAYTLTTTHHEAFRPVVVHEFGHSFCGLADEYYYDDQYENYYGPEAEPWEANITTLNNFASKWQDMLAPKTAVPTKPDPKKPEKLGAYEGGGYMSHGVYRPRQDCRMKTNACADFCPVCQRALERMIRFYTE